MTKRYDVIIIGGGPAGSTAAAILAQQGISVAVFEQSQFPRYHIGESLLPSAIDFLQMSGAYDRVKSRGYTPKQGAYFQWGQSPTPWSVKFGDLIGKDVTTFQVDRADFDHTLLLHAEDCGAKTFQRTKVEKLILPTDKDTPFRVTVNRGGRVREVESTYLIDASGRAGLVTQHHFQSRTFHPEFRNVAIWGYWRNAKALPPGLEGAVTTAATPDGWLWGIPLSCGLFSVGAVCDIERFKAFGPRRKRDLYYESISQSPVMSELLAGADLEGRLRFEQEFSYWSEKVAADRLFVCGDAACFIDPILSSGVHLAMLSSVIASASITSQQKGVITGEEATNFFETLYLRTFFRFATFVSQFYRQNQSSSDYFAQAAGLVNGAFPAEQMQLAFLNLVSGIDDLRQVTSSSVDEICDEVSRRIDENISLRKDRRKLHLVRGSESADRNNAFFNAIEGVGSLLEGAGGLRIQIEPTIEVVRVGSSRKKSA